MASDTMFLVLDMINDIVHEDGPNGKKGYGPELARRRTIPNTAEALRKARAAGVKIGYVRVGFSPDYRECPPTSKLFQGARKAGLFKLGTWGTEVHPALAPQPGDFDIVKHRVSPFYATPLEAILRANGIRRLVVSGVSTSGAVLSAAKDGHDRDYDIVVLEDCCCALTEAQHQAVIEQMQRIATITTSAEMVFQR
ncbi:MAG: cysteine hydrolase [Betaproteobacteria bacterium]|nr:cysteine hydrolase [Betaproteobacteria bacterium]